MIQGGGEEVSGREKRETLGRKEKFGSESLGKEEGRAKGHIGIVSALHRMPAVGTVI